MWVQINKGINRDLGNLRKKIQGLEGEEKEEVVNLIEGLNSLRSSIYSEIRYPKDRLPPEHNKKHFYDGYSLIKDSDKIRETRGRVRGISTDYTETEKSIVGTGRAAKDEDTRTAVGLKSAIIANNIVGHLHISHEVMKTILSKLESDPEFLDTYLDLIKQWEDKIVPMERVYPRSYARFVLRWVSDPLFGTEVLGLGKLKAIIHSDDSIEDDVKDLLADTLPTMFSDFKPITRKDGKRDTSTARRIKQSGHDLFNTNAIYTSRKNFLMNKNAYSLLELKHR